jgi:hypothetical protein
VGKAYSTHGETRNAYRDLVGRPRCRWEDNIEMDLWEIGWGVMGLIHVDHDRDR